MEQAVLNLWLVGLLLVFPVWRIFRRAGLSPWLSLTLFVPMVGFVVAMAILAFARWRLDPK